MRMTLGDGFNRRKKLAGDIASWTNRLKASGNTKRTFRCKAIEGKDAFTPEPGSEKTTSRHYTVEECRDKIRELIDEDRILALRISLTNQSAKAEVEDLNGKVRTYSVPELLVLKDSIIPKLEEAARAVPLRTDGVNVMDVGDNHVRYRQVNKVERKKETFSDKGLKAEEMETLGYDVTEVTDYGLPSREVWNEIDRIQEFLQRVKQAINRANKTELVDL
ncbi:MAG: hypothetical protein H0T65_07170 [Deltaproteobacteria bacterium]|nr:hypothetical protein [Deltaproteobacteria bacterium]